MTSISSEENSLLETKSTGSSSEEKTDDLFSTIIGHVENATLLLNQFEMKLDNTNFDEWAKRAKAKIAGR